MPPMTGVRALALTSGLLAAELPGKRGDTYGPDNSRQSF